MPRCVRSNKLVLVASCLLFISLIWSLVPYVPTAPASVASGLGGDKIDKSISQIHDLDGLQAAADKRMPAGGNYKRNMAVALTEVVALHGVHGVARQSWRQNWIANVLDRFAPRGVSFAGRMRPEGLAKENIMFCSQASLLLQALMDRNGIERATVIFPGPIHSAVAAKPDGVWRFYDASYEPLVQGMPFDQLTHSDEFRKIYMKEPFVSDGLNQKLYEFAKRGQIKIGDINGTGPWKGILFQKIIAWLSNWGWVMPLATGGYLLYLRNWGSSDDRITIFSRNSGSNIGPGGLS